MEDGNTRLADISEHLSLRRRSRRCRSCPRCYKLRPTDIPALSGALPSATALNRDRDVSRTSVQPRQHFYRHQDPYVGALTFSLTFSLTLHATASLSMQEGWNCTESHFLFPEGCNCRTHVRLPRPASACIPLKITFSPGNTAIKHPHTLHTYF